MTKCKSATEHTTDRSKADRPEANGPEPRRTETSRLSSGQFADSGHLGSDLLLVGTHFTATLLGSILSASGVVG